MMTDKIQLRERNALIERITSIDLDDFDNIAIGVFEYQYKYNELYKKYVDLIAKNKNLIQELEDIPFLPIQFFKSQQVTCFPSKVPEKIFRSSTTTGNVPSEHKIYDLALYHHACKTSFATCLGKDPFEFQWLGLLPSYLERDDASLIEMVSYFNAESKYVQDEPFYLNQYDRLNKTIQGNFKHGIPMILIGVTFAVLDWLDSNPKVPQDFVLIETGGMKGRRKEITREELHSLINGQLGKHILRSEYGMTELMSQAYWIDGYFKTPEQMKIIGRDITDPLHVNPTHRTQALNIIDLYNIDSCAFIATDDIGFVKDERNFLVNGRLDITDIRGCNLMVS